MAITVIADARGVRTAPGFHPRLRKLGSAIERLMKIDDGTELAAVLDDLQTLLFRCGYHIDFAHAQRTWNCQKPRAARIPFGPTPGQGRRGRRPGSANWANRQLGLGLAMIWYEHSGRMPARRFDAYGEMGEHGPYREFVACVLSALPKPLRAARKGRVPEIDHLVRTSIVDFKAARASSNEARRRGLLDDSCWIGADADAWSAQGA